MSEFEFKEKRKQTDFTAEEIIIERIIRWFRTPRPAEVKDLSFALNKYHNPTLSELDKIEEWIKLSVPEPSRNFYAIIANQVREIRKNQPIVDSYKRCSFKLCDGNGFLYAVRDGAKNFETMFRCRCNSGNKKIQVWNQALYPEYSLTDDSRYKEPENDDTAF